MKKNSQKGFIVPVIITVVALLIIGGVYFVFKKAGYVTEDPNKKSVFRDVRVTASYQILNNESLWRVKYIESNVPTQWNIAEKNINLKEVQQNKFICGNVEAQFIKYSSYNNGSIGGWNNISVIDCLDYYFVYEFGDAGPKLYGPFNKVNN